LFDVSDIEYGPKSLKSGKSSGIDDLCAENILYAHPSIIIHLKLLFNMICTHGFVPDAFGEGITVPVIKDQLGDHSLTSNYRPITVGPVISKLFEYCILNKFEHLFHTDPLQFGFKKNSSCSRAIFVLSQTTDYFLKHGSNMYLAALDATKAFDRVHHIKLFDKLIGRGFPGRIIKVLLDWYGKTFSTVKWYGCFSQAVCVRSGIRQGGVLSPLLFNIYINSLLCALRSSDLGCHLGDVYVGCIAYADDILLLSASLVNLQKMLNICHSHGDDLDIIFNPGKSCLFKVGKCHNELLPNLRINDAEITWVNSLKYLGVHFVSGRSLNVDISPLMRKFYAAANAILSHSKDVTEITRLYLLESFTLPMLTYGLNVLFLSQFQLKKLNSCWNSIYRRIFGFCKWESVKEIQLLCERLDLIHLIDKSKFEFFDKMYKCENYIIDRCGQLVKRCINITQLYNRYDVYVDDKVCSFAVSRKFYQTFGRRL